VQYFREAVNAAQNAANLAQTASTPAEWQAVADSWEEAIALMKQVPESDPNYATAQQKAIDYQPNLDYAQQNAQQ
jgi:pilus assembly protein FimV